MNLRVMAKLRPCLVRLPGICNRNDDTTVLAHFRILGVSGIGMKSPDIIAAWACSACHEYVDTHKDPRTQLAFAHGVFRTIATLVKEGAVSW